MTVLTRDLAVGTESTWIALTLGAIITCSQQSLQVVPLAALLECFSMDDVIMIARFAIVSAGTTLVGESLAT